MPIRPGASGAGCDPAEAGAVSTSVCSFFFEKNTSIGPPKTSCRYYEFLAHYLPIGRLGGVGPRSQAVALSWFVLSDEEGSKCK